MSGFKIAAAQIPSVRGDVSGNIRVHLAAIRSAAAEKVTFLVFPELSLIGYEPDLAEQLAIIPDDERLAPIAVLAKQCEMTVVLGAALKNEGAKPGLGTVIFTPDGARRTYSKMHLGGSEPIHFAPGRMPVSVANHGQTVGIALCADSAKPSHPQHYAEEGCTVYASGVFLNAEWYATDSPRLAEYAARFQMLVLMANHADSTGSLISVGRSAAWAPGGKLLTEARGTESCLVIADRPAQAWRGQVVALSI